MGVVTVHQIPVTDGRTPQQVINHYSKLLEMMDGRKSGTYQVDCETYTIVSANSAAKSVNVFHNSDYPASTFALLDTGLCLTADTSLDALLATLQGNLLSAKKTLARIEAKGTRWEFGEGDFIAKLGTVSIGQYTKGVVLELEYRPCVVPSMCWDLIKEFSQMFAIAMSTNPGSIQSGQFPGAPINYLVNQPPPYLVHRMNEPFQPVDIIHQYNELYNGFRKAQPIITGNRSGAGTPVMGQSVGTPDQPMDTLVSH